MQNNVSQARGRVIIMIDIITNNFNHYTLFLPGEARCACRQAASKGSHNPTPHWTRQIQARSNQPWAQYSVYVPAPASRGQIVAWGQVKSTNLVGLRAAGDVVQWAQEQHGPLKHGQEIMRREAERERQQPQQPHAQISHRAKVGLAYPPVLRQQFLRGLRFKILFVQKKPKITCFKNVFY